MSYTEEEMKKYLESMRVDVLDVGIVKIVNVLLLILVIKFVITVE